METYRGKVAISRNTSDKAIPDIMAVDIRSWAELQSYVAQLKKPALREKYETIVIDTLDEMAWLAEQHILKTHGVKAIGEIPYGQGYSELGRMFKEVFTDLIRNYGVLVLAQCKERQDPEDEDLKYFSLTVNATTKSRVLPQLDILAFVQSGRAVTDPRIMHFRGTERWEAKSRFANITPSVEFSYTNLVKAIQDATGADAIGVEHKHYHTTLTDEMMAEFTPEQFNEYKEEVLKLGYDKVNAGHLDAVQAITRKLLRGDAKIKDMKIDEIVTLRLIHEELKTLI